MNGVIWFLWLTITIGTCHSSYGNYDTGKYCVCSEPSHYFENKNASITSHPNYVSLGYLPRKGQPTKGTKRPIANQVAEKPPEKIYPSKHKNPEIRALVQDVDRFRVKHTYMDGWFGEHINSFDELTKNPSEIRRYLVELNRRMFKSQILPATISSTQTFEKWMEGAKNKPKIISMIDTYLEQLQIDISSQPDFQTYLKEVQKGTRNTREGNLFITEKEYPITEITLQVDDKNSLEVKIKRFTARVKIGMKGDTIYHYDGSGQWVINENSVSEMSFVDVSTQETILQTRFLEAELKANEKATLEFWREVFETESIKHIQYTGALNEKAARFKELVTKFEKQWKEVVSPPGDDSHLKTPGACTNGGSRIKKRAGSGCAFYLDSDGEVESIHPEEFMEVFEGASEEGRGRMVGLLKNNGNKYIMNDDKNWLAARRRLNQLIHHDEMSIHAELVETTGTIQDWRRWNTPVPKKPSQIVTAISEAVSNRLNNVKLSASKVVDNLARNPHVNKFEKAFRRYGSLMMAKGLINGIIHNDTTAIAVIGSRLGYDVVTEVGTEVGTKFFSEATKVGKGARVLGRVAGPIGAVVDIGLGAWSLTKSVERLRESDNKYDRDDAIADIVGESIDMAIGAATLVLSAVFPPAAPLVFAAALVINILTQMATSLFKAGNEVARIGSEISLTGAEKFDVFASRFFDIFGLREKDYIDYLVEEKHANDLAVKSYLEFLRSTDQFMGVLFPSRALSMDGGCTLVHTECIFVGFGNPCREVGRWTGCSRNAPCSDNGYICADKQFSSMNYMTFLKCLCDDNTARTDFGVPHTDSDVDFSQKRKVFWERAVPGDVSGAEFKCKPSHLEFTDHRIQQSDSRNEYHCHHAIGLYLPEKERKKGQSFLINLEDGKDSLVTNPNSDDTPYTFWLGEKGQKSFHGGKSRNDFILNGNCSEGLLSGNLYGASEATDSLIIGPSCAKGEVVQFINPEMSRSSRLKVYLRDKLDLDLEYIENIIGRPKDAENVEVVCNTRKLFLNGGASSSNPDVIKVGLFGCPLNLIAVLGNYTNFSSQALDGEITVYVGHDMEGSSINVIRRNLRIYKNPKTTIIFTETTAEIIDIQQTHLTSRESSLKLWDSSNHERDQLTVNFSNERPLMEDVQHQIFFNESSVNAPNMFSILMIPADDGRVARTNGPLYFFHNLQENKASIEKRVRRVGNQNVPNLFNISGDHWNLIGGSKDDTFLLNTDLSKVKIDGKGGQDTLVVQQVQSSVINLNGNEKVRSIETIVKGDKVGSSLEVSTGCNTKAVVTKGDDSKFPDIVQIHKCTETRELQIDAGGWSSVVVDGDLIGENEIVKVIAHKTSCTPVKFRLETGDVQASNMFVQIELGSDKPGTLKLLELIKNQDGKSFRAVMKGGGVDLLDLNLRINDNDGFYLTTPQIQLLPESKLGTRYYPSQLVFRRDTLQPVVVHVTEKYRLGFEIVCFEGLQNLFQIQSDYFTLEGCGLQNTFIGGALDLAETAIKPNKNSENTLVITNYVNEKKYNFGEGKPFHVNLQQERMGFKLDRPKIYNGEIIGGYIQHVFGRPNLPDVITTGCVVKSVAGRGGLDANDTDLIVVSDNDKCEGEKESEMEVHLGKYSKVENSAEKGNFTYFVDLEEPLASNPFNITSSATNQHKIMFQGDQHKSRFTFINFDQRLEKLSFNVGNEAIMEFSMYRADKQSDYVNPKFLVTSKENGVTRDIRVDNGGSVVATALLDSDCVNTLDRSAKGFPVDINNFLINITTQGDHVNCETVIKAEETSVSNHFWMYGISGYNQLTIRGVENPEKISSLHLDQDFHGNQSIIADLSSEHGKLSISGQPEVKLMFIDSFVGRSNPVSYDTVIPSCYTKQVSGVDLVDVKINRSTDCAYNLIVGMESSTLVNFDWIDNDGSGPNNISEFLNSTFHYRFTEPMSFELNQSYPLILDGTEHNLYLPFNLDQMDTLTFVEEENKLYYTIDSKKYSVTMISEPGDEDQFYTQPNMVTQDGLRLLVGRDASLLISGQLTGSNLTGPELLEKYQDLANVLGVTILIQTDVGILHVGHDGINLDDRNVVQNVAYSDSYLGGGGALHTIYEVVSLNKNVYISTGLNDEIFEKSSVNSEGPYSVMQTLDLTDIVSPIRYQTMKKYKPTINQVGDDLVITMEGHLDKYPGQIVIYGGVSQIVRDKLQVLLSHAMMKIVPLDFASGNNWQLVPLPVRLERETVYSLAAEDLEYDHHISIIDHLYGPEYHFRFNYSKHGDDLHLSDVEEFRDHRYDQRHIEMTTVIITDFYKKLTTDQINLTEGNSTQEYAPAEIVNVTLDLPGLKIKLDGTDVFLLSDENQIATKTFLSPTIENLSLDASSNFTPSTVFQKFSSQTATKHQSSVLLSLKGISEWDNVLHQVEQEILEDLPFVHRIY